MPKATKLGVLLQQLTKQPQPVFPTVKSLSLKLAARNDHWGARHFLKEDLPRIAYANPNMFIKVDRLPKTLEETQWQPELNVEFVDGKKSTLQLADKLSSDIMKQLSSTVNFTELLQTKDASQRDSQPSP